MEKFITDNKIKNGSLRGRWFSFPVNKNRHLLDKKPLGKIISNEYRSLLSFLICNPELRLTISYEKFTFTIDYNKVYFSFISFMKKNEIYNARLFNNSFSFEISSFIITDKTIIYDKIEAMLNNNKKISLKSIDGYGKITLDFSRSNLRSNDTPDEVTRFLFGSRIIKRYKHDGDSYTLILDNCYDFPIEFLYKNKIRYGMVEKTNLSFYLYD